MSYLLPSMTLTAKGRRLYGKAHSGECGIEFTKIAVGTGYIDSPDEVAALTALKSEVNATVSALTIRAIDDSTVCISARITAADAPFYMREIGLIANDPDEGSILYGYCNFADTADYVETYKGLFAATQDIDIYVAVGNSANFSVDITEVVTATPKDVLDAEERLTAKIEAEAEARATADATLEKEKTENKVVTSLPSTQAFYNFDNNTALFSVPSIGETVKGISETVADEENDGYYQRVCSTGAEGASTTIGSTANVYSQFDFASITANATDMTIEFDFQYVINGRIRLALCDLDIINGLSNSDIRYNTSGIAIDLFSTSNSRFQINSEGNTRTSFFGAWLHGKFEIDFITKTVKYTIFVKDNESDSITGTANFRDVNCSKVTGIALYTWFADDTILFDNIKIVSRINVSENTLYIIKNEIGIYQTYKYIDGEPVLLAGEDLSDYATKTELANGLSGKSDTGHTHTQLHTHSNKSVLDGITAAKVSEWNNKAPLASPAFTGSPTAPTQNSNDSSTKIATTAFVNTALSNALGLSGGTTDAIVLGSSRELLTIEYYRGYQNTPIFDVSSALIYYNNKAYNVTECSTGNYFTADYPYSTLYVCLAVSGEQITGIQISTSKTGIPIGYVTTGENGNVTAENKLYSQINPDANAMSNIIAALCEKIFTQS